MRPCEYCGKELPEGVDKGSRQIRSSHFQTHAEERRRVEIAAAEPDLTKERIEFETAAYAHFVTRRVQGKLDRQLAEDVGGDGTPEVLEACAVNERRDAAGRSPL